MSESAILGSPSPAVEATSNDVKTGATDGNSFSEMPFMDESAPEPIEDCVSEPTEASPCDDGTSSHTNDAEDQTTNGASEAQKNSTKMTKSGRKRKGSHKMNMQHLKRYLSTAANSRQYPFNLPWARGPMRPIDGLLPNPIPRNKEAYFKCRGEGYPVPSGSGAGLVLLPLPATSSSTAMQSSDDDDGEQMNPSTPEMQEVEQFIRNNEYQRLYQYILDNVPEGSPILPTVDRAIVFAIREISVQAAFAECLQCFRHISHPTPGMLEALSDMVVDHVEKLSSNETDIWLVFNKSISWHISSRVPVPPSLIDSIVRCFGALNSWGRIWSALQMCYQSNCLPTGSISKKTLERLLTAMLLENVGGVSGGFGFPEAVTTSDNSSGSASISLAIRLLEPYLGSPETGSRPLFGDSIRCDLLVRLWLRCIDENETDFALRVGGQGGAALVTPVPFALAGDQTNSQERETVLTILRNRIAELIITEKFVCVSNLFTCGYHFLPDLADAMVTNLLMVGNTQKALESLVKLLQYKIQGSGSQYHQEAQSEISRCLAYVSHRLVRCYCERRQWLAVIQLHESLISTPLGMEMLTNVLSAMSPSFALQYPLDVVEAAFRGKRFPLGQHVMKSFSIFVQPCEDAAVRNRRYTLLREYIESAVISNEWDSAIAAFWTCQAVFDTDPVLECPVDVNEMFNDLIVRSCKAGGENTSRALDLGRRGMCLTRTRLVVLAFPLRILLSESVRQGCCGSVTTGFTPEQEENKRCVLELAERGFQVSIYPRPEVRMTNLPATQNLFIPTDATTEEIHVLITIYCRALRQQLLNFVRQNAATDVLNLCELSIWPYNVGVRDVQLMQLYQLDGSAQGVLKRVEQVLAMPLFLSGAIEAERQSGYLPGTTVFEPKLVVQKFKLYHVVYYSKLD